MKYLILIFALTFFSCNKEETPEPIINQTASVVINSYSMTTSHLGNSLNSQYNVLLNGTKINSFTTITISTGDQLTGTIKVLGNQQAYTGLTFYLNGLNKYTKDGYIDSNGELLIDYTVE